MTSSPKKLHSLRSQTQARSSAATPSPPSSQRPAAAPGQQGFRLPEVASVADTGLSLGFIADLVLKIMYFEGFISGRKIAEMVKLPFNGVVEEALEFMRREKLCEVKGAGGLGMSSYQFIISDKGSDKAREALERSMYVGPAPVPLKVYADSVRQQPLKNVIVPPSVMHKMLAHLVLSEEIFNKVGPAVQSARSIFLYGPPGNGKTAIAEGIGHMLMTSEMYIPYAFEAAGHVVKVFDDVSHHLAEEQPGDNGGTRNGQVDKRWVKIKRPVVAVGGELTLEALDLAFDETSRFYEAPFQVKANGGMFLIDDFGRQRARPQDLLNRWIVPLEKRIDYLTLRTGNKIEVPFDVLIVFSTNLEPKDLVDEAFLRRIRNRIHIADPSYEHFRKIFRQLCKIKGLSYNDEVLAYLLKEHYVKKQRPLRACHPRDLIDNITDNARFLGVLPQLNKETIDKACESYFVAL